MRVSTSASMRLLRTAAAAIISAFPSSVDAGELRIVIGGIRSAHGTVLIGLYDSSASFAKAVDAAVKEGFLIDPDRFAAVALRANAALRSAVVFSNLAPGRYAAVTFHDENGNGKLDKSFLGVPVEPYGFSNDVQGFLGPPSFDDAAMELGEGNKEIRITLIYRKGSN